MLISQDEKVDWFRIVCDLCANGYTHATIAAAIGAGKSTVQGWKQGSTPNYEDGERLITLWCAVTQNGRESVRRVKRYSHHA